MDVYFIRHGESESNANGTHAGWAPVSLTENGRKQVENAKKRLEGLTFDRLFVSDVLRTQQTAEILFPGMDRTFLPLAREMNNTTMRGKTKEDMLALFPELYPACRAEFDYALLGIDCESKWHLSNRARETLNMLSSLEGVKRAAVVTHAGFIRAVAGQVLGLRPYEPTLMCFNASINVFCWQNGEWRLKMWNLPPEMP